MEKIQFELTSKVINAAMEVHTHLGPGLLESAYRTILRYELQVRGMNVVEEMALPIVYKEIKLDHGYRMDLLVENTLVVEIKTVEAFAPVHTQQILTYLRLGKYPCGLLMNFHVSSLRFGLKRFVM